MASSTCDKYAARELDGMYGDPSNELYLTFLKPILCDFERVNLLFQQESADQSRLFHELENFTLLMLRRVLCPEYVKLAVDWNFSSNLLPLERVDFGYEFYGVVLWRRLLTIFSHSSREISSKSNLLISAKRIFFLFH